MDTSLTLRDKGSGQPLTFEASDFGQDGFWTFDTADGQTYTIQGQSGEYITCETTGDKICSSGKEPQYFEWIPSDDDVYIFLEKTSGLFLRLLLPQIPVNPFLQLGSKDDLAKFKLQTAYS